MLKIIIPMALLLSMTEVKWNKTALVLAFMPMVGVLLIKPEIWAHPMNSFMTLDFLSVSLILLTLWITPLMFMASQYLAIMQYKEEKFKMLVIVLTLILISCFSVNNLFLFYIMFEASLLPTLLIVLTWGYQPERIQAGMYLMLYTISSSLPLLISIIYFYYTNYTMSLVLNSCAHFSYSKLTWIVMNLAFMVKLPAFTTHLWLPKAHVEAPVAGSMVLAAILLKLGGYGMFRMMAYISPLDKVSSHMIMSLALWGGAITSLICVRQTDMKSLIAYSSVGHMSLVIAGVMTNNLWGAWGALTMMIAHGLVSSSMFASANYMYEMSSSRNLSMNKGVNVLIPSMATMWFIGCAANMAAPPSINLLSEIMLISTTLATFSMIIPLSLMSYMAAAYSLILYTYMNHGSQNSSLNMSMKYKMNKIMCFTLHLIPVFALIMSPAMVAIW